MEEDDAHDVLGGDLEPMLRGEIGFAGEEDVTSPAHLAHKGDTAFITSSTETPDGRSRMSFASSPAVSKRTAEPSGMTEPVYQMPSRDGSVEITGLAHQNSTQPSSPPHAYKVGTCRSFSRVFEHSNIFDHRFSAHRAARPNTAMVVMCWSRTGPETTMKPVPSPSQSHRETGRVTKSMNSMEMVQETGKVLLERTRARL